MSKISIIFGGVLIVLGAGFYFGTGAEYMTALIPAFLGAAIAVCGALAMKSALRAIFAHIALVLGVLGCLVGLGRGGTRLTNISPGVIEQLLMGVICAVYVFLCIQSFRAARKARQ